MWNNLYLKHAGLRAVQAVVTAEAGKSVARGTGKTSVSVGPPVLIAANTITEPVGLAELFASGLLRIVND